MSGVERFPTTTTFSQRVLLLLQPGRDRDLLVEWLSDHSEYTPFTRDPSGQIDEPFDICLADAESLRSHHPELHRAVRADAPVFLPIVLLLPDADTGRVRAFLEDLDSSGELVDDVLTLPVDGPILEKRLESHLRTRRTATTLTERREQYEALVELSPESIVLLRDEVIVYANAAAATLFGVDDPRELFGWEIGSLVAAESRAELLGLLDRIRAGERLDEFHDLAVATTTGSRRDTEVAGVAVTYEDAPAVQLLIRDITHIRTQQRQLALFGRAIDATAQGVTIADNRQPDTPLVYVNPAFERITGYSAAEATGRNCRFLQGANTAPEPVAEMHEAIEAGKPVSVELLNYRRDGTPFYNSVDITPVTDADGTVTHFVGLQRDVTDRRQQTERISVLNRVLRHNIRNRMNVISGHADLLAEELDSSATEVDSAAAEVDSTAAEADSSVAAKSVHSIAAAADDLLRISDQIKDFRGLVSMDRTELRSTELVGLLERLAAGLHETHPHVTVTLETPPEVVVRCHELLPAALEEFLEYGASRLTEEAEFVLSTVLDENVVRLEIVDCDGAIPESDFQSISHDRETQLAHADGLEPWLIRWAVVYSDGEIRVLDGDRRGLCIRLQRADT